MPATVKSFSARKGWGFVSLGWTPEHGERDAFFHWSDVCDKDPASGRRLTPWAGDVVACQVKITRRGWRARGVTTGAGAWSEDRLPAERRPVGHPPHSPKPSSNDEGDCMLVETVESTSARPKRSGDAGDCVLVEAVPPPSAPQEQAFDAPSASTEQETVAPEGSVSSPRVLSAGVMTVVAASPQRSCMRQPPTPSTPNRSSGRLVYSLTPCHTREKLDSLPPTVFLDNGNGGWLIPRSP